MLVKGEEEHVGVHVKGESTESELDEEEEDEDVVQLREGDEEERGGYTKVRLCVKFSFITATFLHSVSPEYRHP